MKYNKDEIYVVNQPKHSIVSLVVYDDNIIDEIHSNIIKLNKISDVIFIFPNNKEYKKIDKNKLTSLYCGCAWIDSYDSLNFTIFKILDYCIQIFKVHNTFLLINMRNLKNISNKLFNNIESVNASSMKNPIFKVRNLTADEYRDIYTRKVIENNSIFNKIRKFFGIEDELEEETDDDMFCSYTSDSKVLVYFRATINKLIEFNSKNIYSELFNSLDCRYLFASMTKYLNIEITDSNIEDLNIGKLYES